MPPEPPEPEDPVGYHHSVGMDGWMDDHGIISMVTALDWAVHSYSVPSSPVHVHMHNLN